MKRLLIVSILFIYWPIIKCISPTDTLNSEEKKYSWGIEYNQRFLYFDQKKWNGLIPPDVGLPELKNYVRFHGAKFYVEFEKGFQFGLSAYGALSENRNSVGYTSWEGAMAGFFGDYRKRLFLNLYGNVGLTMGCGRFSFSSLENSGVGVNGKTHALLIEPHLGLSYYFFKQFYLKVTASSVFDFWRDTIWLGVETTDSVMPRGFFLNFSIGARFK